jgi:outer membrane protein W
MKKILAVWMVSCGMCMVARAQTFSIGPNAGFGATWIDNFKDKKFKSAGNVGLSFIYSTKSSFGIGADVKYSFEGGERQYTTSIPGLIATEEASLNYVRVPIKAMWFFGDYGQRVRPKIALGPSFGFLVGGKTELKYSNPTIVPEVTESKDSWDDFDLGVTASVGLNYRLVTNTWLTADISYLHGITDAREDSKRNVNRNYVPGTNYKNRNVQLNVGVNFGL